MVETGDIRIRVTRDDNPESPRDTFDNLGTMTCWHRSYQLGDKHSHEDRDNFFLSLIEESDLKVVRKIVAAMVRSRRALWDAYKENDYALPNLPDKTSLEIFIDAHMANESVQQVINKVLAETILILPIHMYDHSGISLSTEPFSCAWDSGQVGFNWVTHEDIKKSWSTDPEWLAKATEVLKIELKTYDQFATADVWGLNIEKADVCRCCGAVTWEDVESCYGFYGTDFDNGMADHVDEEHHELLKEALASAE